VRANILNIHSVEFLFIDGEDPEVWYPWFLRTAINKRPRVFVWMGPSEALETESQGPISKPIRKKLEREGYHLQYVLLSSEKLGSGIAQDRLVLLGTLKGPGWIPVQCNTDLGLPRRAMSNLLMPVGVPYKAWHHGLVRATTRAERWWPCDVIAESEGEPIFERFGLMPDRPHSLIRSERGIRRLQHQ
jgi:hypothetical protein